MYLGLEIEKTNIGIRISIFKILCVPSFSKKWWLGTFDLGLPKNGFSVEPASSRYHVYQFLGKTNNFDIFGPSLSKNGFWGRNFKNLSLNLESTRPRYLVQRWGCWRDLGGVWNELGGGGWSWMEVEISWLEVDGAEWSWVEVDGAWWSWVHGLVISN